MLTNENLTVETVTAELNALDGEYQKRLDALAATHKEYREQLRKEIIARRRTYKRLLDVLTAEAGEKA